MAMSLKDDNDDFLNQALPDTKKYRLYFDMADHEESMTASLMKERTPSWSTIEGILSDKYKSSDDQAYTQPTQSTQNTVVQRPLTPETPRGVYYSQPQYRRRSVGAVSELPSSLPTRVEENRFARTAEFGVSQKQTLDRLKKEILLEESKILARTGELSSEMRKQAEAAITEPQTYDAKLDLSQPLSHSILEEQSKTRLKIAKPNSDNENVATVSTISVDMTPLTEDLLMNSRVDVEGDNPDYVSITQSDGGKTISDTQMPNLDDDELIFTPLSDDELTRFGTPPRTTVVKEDIIKPAPRHPGKRRVQLRSQGKVIGSTELTSFDETSSLSVADNYRFKDVVKPLKRHAWSDSETENSMSKTGNKNQFENNLFTHQEPVSVSAAIPIDRPKSASAKHDDIISNSLFRPYTAPSSEKLEKFEINPRNEDIPLVKSDSTINSDDLPNLRNSFISLQQTIMSDIAALRKEIVEKQAGTERLRAEFCDFKHAYYESLVEKKAAESRKVDALIQTSQNKEKENISPAREKDSTYSGCDSDTERQLATLKVLQRSLRQQAEERKEEEKKLLQRMAKDKAHQTETRVSYSRSIQTSPKPKLFSDMQVNTSPYSTRAQQTSLRERDLTPPRTPDVLKQISLRKEEYQKDVDEFDLPLKSPSPKAEKDDSLDSTEKATREMFMEILRKKAEIDEKERDEKRKHRFKESSTPKPSGLIPSKGTFTPASTVVSDDCSTITDGTYVVEDDVAALDGLWKEFMKYVIQSRVLKHHKSKRSSAKRKPCLRLDTENLQKLQDSISNMSPKRKVVKNKGRPEIKKFQPAEAFEVSLPDRYDPKTYRKKSPKSIDSREERINFLIKEIENEKRNREEAIKKGSKSLQKSDDLDKVPSKEDGVHTPQKPPSPPPRPLPPVISKPTRKEPVAFDISWDIDSLTSEEVERAPGYPNMIFKTGKLQDAFYAHRRNFIKKSRRRALHIQLRKEAREKFRSVEPPPRPRPTIDPKYFAAFDIPPPETRVISEKQMRKNSKNLYQRLSEVQEKKHQEKVKRERETYRLRGQNYSKRVLDQLLGKKFMNSVRVF